MYAIYPDTHAIMVLLCTVSHQTIINTTGWRVGWALSTPELLKGLAVYHGITSYCAPSPFQHGLAVALGVEDGSFEASAKRPGFLVYQHI